MNFKKGGVKDMSYNLYFLRFELIGSWLDVHFPHSINSCSINEMITLYSFFSDIHPIFIFYHLCFDDVGITGYLTMLILRVAPAIYTHTNAQASYVAVLNNDVKSKPTTYVLCQSTNSKWVLDF